MYYIIVHKKIILFKNDTIFIGVIDSMNKKKILIHIDATQQIVTYSH